MSKELVAKEDKTNEEMKINDDNVVIKSVSSVSEAIAPEMEPDVVPVVSPIPEKDALALVAPVPASDVVVVTDESMQNTDNNLKLSFSEVDKSISVDKIEEDVNAPKDLETLEKISEINNKKRKEEEEDDYEEEKLVISNETIKLDTLDINEIPVKLNDKNPLLSDIEVLT